MSASYINDLLSAGSVWFVWLIARSCAFFASPKRIGERRSCKSAPWHSIPCQSMRYERNLFWSRGRGRPLSNQRTIRRLFMRLRSKICDFYRPFNEPRCPDPTWRSVSIFSFRPPPLLTTWLKYGPIRRLLPRPLVVAVNCEFSISLQRSLRVDEEITFFRGAGLRAHTQVVRFREIRACSSWFIDELHLSVFRRNRDWHPFRTLQFWQGIMQSVDDHNSLKL